MQHNLGTLTLPKEPEVAIFTDSLSVKLGLVAKSYLNLTLGNAWKQVSNNDGYIVKNVRTVPVVNLSNMIQSQLPALFVYRTEIQRKSFTQSSDMLISKLMVEYVLPITDATQETKWGVVTAIPTALESMVHRNLNVDGYTLLEHLSIESITFIKSNLKTVKDGFYQVTTEFDVVEIVNPATEDYEDLDFTTLRIDLGTENQATIEDYMTVEYIDEE